MSHTPLRVASIVGARPQFIKLGAISKSLASLAETDSELAVEHIIIHTGQHYDERMSGSFFHELALPSPDINLGIGSGSHGAQTGAMLKGLEDVLCHLCIDLVLLYGDTNSTLAGALAASKLNISVAHIESGLRSFRKSMPEEINRITTDHVSTLLFCPTRHAAENLIREGISGVICDGELVNERPRIGRAPATVDSPWIVNVGDVMYDSVLFHAAFAPNYIPELSATAPHLLEYAVLTVHRAENTDSASRLREIFIGANRLAEDIPVICPLHPRTVSSLEQHELRPLANRLILVEAVPYHRMLSLIKHSQLVLTDSGGIQREAFMLGKPCVILRSETEWVELLETGTNRLAGANSECILHEARELLSLDLGDAFASRLYGDGRAAERILRICWQWWSQD